MLCLAVTLGLAGCTCVQRGMAIGAGAGAIVGGAIGAATDEAGEGALIGAGSGGLIGALVGDGMCKTDSSDEVDNLKAQIAALTDDNEKLRNGRPAGKACEFVIEGDTLFASGSNVLTERGKETLNALATKIRKDYPGKPLNIEGHTDSVPITYSGWRSNWELGSGRALSVLHYMLDTQRFEATTMSATTFGEFKPARANDTPENRQQNRRAVIVVQVQ
jgi:flagellar motor protein MotB